MYEIPPKILLDTDFWTVFKTFYYFESIFCLCNFNFIGGFAYQVTSKYLCLSIGFGILVIIFFCLTLIPIDFQSNTQEFIYFLTYSQYVIIFCCVSISIHSQNKVIFKLVRDFQQICMHIKNPEDTPHFIRMTRVTFTLLLIFYILVILVKVTTDMYWHWTRSLNILFIASTLMLEVQLLKVSYLLRYLVHKQKKWILVLRTKRYVNLKVLKLSFEMVAHAFSLIKRAYQMIIALHFILAFLQIVIYIGMVIHNFVELKADMNRIINHGVVVSLWFGKALVIESFLCLSFEEYYRAIEATRATVINHAFDQYQSSKSSVERSKLNLNHFAKCIVRSIDTSFSKLWACGLFPIDVTTPLQLGSLAATYVIILLQFFLQNQRYT